MSDNAGEECQVQRGQKAKWIQSVIFFFPSRKFFLQASPLLIPLGFSTAKKPIQCMELPKFYNVWTTLLRVSVLLIWINLMTISSSDVNDMH